MDGLGHGTGCAGIIGAVGNNGLGITGINWTVRIMCVKTHKDYYGGGTSTAIINGIHYAIENGAHITSDSYGCDNCPQDQAMIGAIEKANQAGILFVASAGNAGWSTDENPHYPSSYDNENIISVTATDKNDNQRYNWGTETVDMAGCSPEITTTKIGNRYNNMFGGTSAACPHVAGVAALVWGKEPSLIHMEVKTRLMDTVRPVPSIIGMCVTDGTVNAYNALSVGGPPPPPPATPSNLTAKASACDQIDLTWYDNSDNEDGFKIERSLDASNFDQIDTVGANVTTYSNTGLAENTLYWYRVRAYNAGGNSGYSNIANDTTPACPGEPPAAPTDLTAKARGKNKIALKWKDNSNNEDGFYIYRSLEEINFNWLNLVGRNTTSYVDTGLVSKETYYYKVCAYNAYEEGCSNVDSASTK